MSEFTSARTSNASAFGDPDAAHSDGCGEAYETEHDTLIDGSGLRTNHYGKEQKVFKEGQPATAIFQIETGAVLISRNDNLGRRRLLEVLGAGSFFGVMQGPLYDCQAETMVPTVLRQIPRVRIEQAAGLKSRIVEQRVWQLEQLRARAQAMTGKSALEKVAAFLLHLPDAEPNTTSQPSVLRAVPNQQDIAGYLGLSAETVCRSMRSLRKENIVCILGRARLAILDRNRLAGLAAGASGRIDQ